MKEQNEYNKRKRMKVQRKGKQNERRKEKRNTKFLFDKHSLSCSEDNTIKIIMWLQSVTCTSFSSTPFTTTDSLGCKWILPTVNLKDFDSLLLEIWIWKERKSEGLKCALWKLNKITSFQDQNQGPIENEFYSTPECMCRPDIIFVICSFLLVLGLKNVLFVIFRTQFFWGRSYKENCITALKRPICLCNST
jgi:hypothetical protein